MTAVEELPAITRKRENSIRLRTVGSLYNFSRSTGGRIDLIGWNALDNVGAEQMSVRTIKNFTDATGTLDVSATVTSGKQSVRKRTRNYGTFLSSGTATCRIDPVSVFAFVGTDVEQCALGAYLDTSSSAPAVDEPATITRKLEQTPRLRTRRQLKSSRRTSYGLGFSHSSTNEIFKKFTNISRLLDSTQSATLTLSLNTSNPLKKCHFTCGPPDVQPSTNEQLGTEGSTASIE